MGWGGLLKSWVVAHHKVRFLIRASSVSPLFPFHFFVYIYMYNCGRHWYATSQHFKHAVHRCGVIMMYIDDQG